MARNKLTVTALRGKLKPGIIGDGDGLYLRVKPSGAASWVFIFKRAGVRKEMGLGPFMSGTSNIGLVEARGRADAIRDQLSLLVQKPLERSWRQDMGKRRTFEQIMRAFIDAKQGDWTSKVHGDQWKMTLEKYASPLHKKYVDDISVDDVKRVLDTHWKERPETAKRLQSRIAAVLDYGTVLGFRTGNNPAKWEGGLKLVMSKQEKGGKHSALAWQDVPAFMQRLAGVEGIGARALEMTIFCATRTSETLNATWAEIDLGAAVWTIPGERMKAGVEHRIPLSGEALGVLEAMRAIKTGDYVFPSARPDRVLSNMAMSAVLKRLGVDVTVHGFRSSFRDWGSDESGHDGETLERALAHTVGSKVEASYLRTDRLEKRKMLMGQWAAYCRGGEVPSNVVLLKKPALN